MEETQKQAEANEETAALAAIRTRQVAGEVEKAATAARLAIRAAAKQARKELDRRKTANHQTYLKVGQELKQARKDIRVEVARLIEMSDDAVSQKSLDNIQHLAEIGQLAIAISHTDDSRKSS
jgi:hypothetical protein